MHGHDMRKLLVLCGLIGLAACTEKDWRAAAIAKAEDEVRDQVNDPVAQFSHVQVTGNRADLRLCHGQERHLHQRRALHRLYRWIRTAYRGWHGSAFLVEAGVRFSVAE